MRRYNCKDFPAEMVESQDGYWVKYEDVFEVIEHAIAVSEHFHKRNADLIDSEMKASREVKKLISICFGLGMTLAIFIVWLVKLSVLMYG